MMLAVLPSLAENVSTKRVIHQIRSPRNVSSKVLVITDYDYFLTKRDLKRLLISYQRIILVPAQMRASQNLETLVQPFEYVHLVTRPGSWQPSKALLVQKSSKFHISTISDFCEETLGKVYIAQSAPHINSSGMFPGFSPGIRLFKKGLDTLLSLGLLVVSSPAWLWSAFKINQQSPGPVFYRQMRVGRKEQEFTCVKFRSMRLDAEASGAAFSSKHDSRTFAFGAFMRKVRLDELPQLLSVLKGEMSLIGPRPERRVFTQVFEEEIPHYQERHIIKPGITGYAQICYPYGAGLQDARHKLMYDLYYIKHWSVRLEAYIFFRTIVTVLTKQGY